MFKPILHCIIAMLFVIPMAMHYARATEQQAPKRQKHIASVKYEDRKAKKDISVTKPVDKSSPSISSGKGR